MSKNMISDVGSSINIVNTNQGIGNALIMK